MFRMDITLKCLFRSVTCWLYNREKQVNTVWPVELQCERNTHTVYRRLSMWTLVETIEYISLRFGLCI